MNIHYVSSSFIHIWLLICTINILYHIRPLTWGTCALYPSYIVRLIANSLYAHGSCECVSDPDTMNIHGVSSPQMRVYQTTCIPCMMYHNGLLLLAIVSLYQPNTMRMVAHLLYFHVSGDWVHGQDMARSHDLSATHMNLKHSICTSSISDHNRLLISLMGML